MLKFSSSLCAVLLAITFLPGCGPAAPPQGTLSGSITINGKVYEGPLELIVMSMQSGKGGSTAIQKDGTFSFDSPFVTGEYTVYLAPSSPPEAKEMAVSVKIDNSIPAEYWNESSPVKIRIKEGKNEIKLKIPQ